jgi:hypothetical protein
MQEHSGTEGESIKKTNGKTRCKCLSGEVWWTRWTWHVTTVAVAVPHKPRALLKKRLSGERGFEILLERSL